MVGEPIENPIDPSAPATKQRQYANTAKPGARIINVNANNLRQYAFLHLLISRYH